MEKAEKVEDEDRRASAPAEEQPEEPEEPEDGAEAPGSQQVTNNLYVLNKTVFIGRILQRCELFLHLWN